MVQDERIIVGFVELFLIGVGLSMDAFAVSVCKGLGMSRLNIRQATIISLFFGGFQALMPLIGWALGSQLADLITPIDHWIAFALLAFVGARCCGMRSMRTTNRAKKRKTPSSTLRS